MKGVVGKVAAASAAKAWVEKTGVDPPNFVISEWIASQFPEGYAGYAMDVGASDGFNISSTYYLETVFPWTVLCIEPNPYWKKQLAHHRALYRICACDDRREDDAWFHINMDNLEAYSALRPNAKHVKKNAVDRWAKIKVPVRTADELLMQQEFPRLDALCVDTEGTEDAVLRGANLAKWKPRVVIVEAWEPGKHDTYLAAFGYQKQWRNVDNDFYIREEV
jgi:FkbM family methyltransferase